MILSNYKFQQMFDVGTSENRLSVLYNTRYKATNWPLLIQGFLCWNQFRNPDGKPQAPESAIPFNELQPEKLIKWLWLSKQGRRPAWD